MVIKSNEKYIFRQFLISSATVRASSIFPTFLNMYYTKEFLYEDTPSFRIVVHTYTKCVSQTQFFFHK